MRQPSIDNQTLLDLTERMREMVPFYTPEWRFAPDDPDPGTALFFLFADMYLQNAQRLNRVPMKNFIAFLNLQGVSLLNAKPAQGYVTFLLNEGTKDTVYVPAGTRVAAQGAEGDIQFETDHDLLLTPAKLTEVFATSSSRDEVLSLTKQLVPQEKGTVPAPVALFDFDGGAGLQQHALLLGHPGLFRVLSGAQIELHFSNSQARYKEAAQVEWLANTAAIEWLYGGADGWVPFDEVKAEGHRLLLVKRQESEIVEQTLAGQASRWICARVKPGQLAAVMPQGDKLVFDGVAVQTHFWAAEDADEPRGIRPDGMFGPNDSEVEQAGGYPFGDFFAPYGMWHVGSQEVLSKPESLAELSFRLKARMNRQFMGEKQIDWKLIMKASDLQQELVYEASIQQVAWEYWNGQGWMRLATLDEDAEKLFDRPGEAFVEKKVRFYVPKDLAETVVNGRRGLYIRARIVQCENLYTINPVHLAPWVEDVNWTYHGVKGLAPAQVVMQNNLDTVVWSPSSKRVIPSAVPAPNATQASSPWFAPFEPLPSDKPALFFGFDQAPVRGPISVYFSFLPRNKETASRPMVEWEYLRDVGGRLEWTRLKTVDGTSGLTRSGTVQFAGPSDLAKQRLFGKEQFWLRAVNPDGAWDATGRERQPAILQGVYLNTAAVTQQESVRDERPEPTWKLGREGFSLTKTPVHSEEVWVDETGALSERDVQELLAADETGIEVIRDAEGHLQRVWVRWEPVELLEDSAAEARQYAIDRSAGRFYFGDGKRGKQPPNGGPDKVKVNYRVIQGEKGNVAARAISQLQQSIAFVGGVFNPDPAGGGCDIEPMAQALQRGPQMLKHRGEAVTASDYEWLARQVNQDIAKVKCLPNVGGRLERETGSVTLVLLPKGGLSARHVFPSLQKQVESFLLDRSPHSVAFARTFRVIEPCYLEISVTASLVVNKMDSVVPAERSGFEKLNQFLDPLTGHYDGQGWEIGQAIHPSIFYALLQSVPDVHHVKQVGMTVFKIEDGVRTEITQEEIARLPHGLVVNGKHQVNVDVLGGEQ